MFQDIPHPISYVDYPVNNLPKGTLLVTLEVKSLHIQICNIDAIKVTK